MINKTKKIILVAFTSVLLFLAAILCVNLTLKNAQSADAATTENGEIPEHAHTSATLTHTAAVDATCTTNGNIEYWSCPTCNKNFSDYKGTTEVKEVVIPAGHSYSRLPAEWTWSADRNTASAKFICSMCGDEATVDSYMIDRKVTLEPSCTEEGLATYTAQLAFNGAEYSDTVGLAIPATGHIESEWITDIVATCIEKGSRYKRCTVCNTVLESEETPVVLHTLIHAEAVASTCTQKGTIEYWYCSYCGTNFSDENGVTEVADLSVETDPNNHSELSLLWLYDEEGHYRVCGACGGSTAKEEHIPEENDGDCTTPVVCNECGYGLVEAQANHFLVYKSNGEGGHTASCTNADCSVTYAEPHSGGQSTCGEAAKCELCGQSYGQLLPHAELTHTDAVASTCTQKGNIEYWSCPECKKNFKEEGGYNVVNDVSSPLLAHTGGTASCIERAKCEVCGTEYGELGMHVLTYSPAVAATCTAQGANQYWGCTVCGANFKDHGAVEEITEITTAIDPDNHSDVSLEWSKDAEGHYHVCGACGEKTDMFPHNGGSATCIDKAVCAACGEAYGGYAEHTGGTATCIAKAICVVCSAVYGDYAEHTGGTATCIAKAKCTVCGAEYGDLVAHKEVTDEAVAATCVKKGLTEGKHCSVCNTVLVAQKEVSMVAHSYGEWIDEVPATATENGTKGHKDCVVCAKHFDADGNELTEIIIPATGEEEKPAEPAKQKLSGGAIAGITIGGVLIALAVLYVTGLILYKKNIIGWKICKIIYFFIK